MSAESEQFRERARQCRGLAKDARDKASRDTLNAMAAELDQEADRIDEHQKRAAQDEPPLPQP